MPSSHQSPLSVVVQTTMPTLVRDVLYDRLGLAFSDEDQSRPMGGHLSSDVRVIASERSPGEWAITAHWIDGPEDLPTTKRAWVQKHLEKARDLVSGLPV